MNSLQARGLRSPKPRRRWYRRRPRGLELPVGTEHETIEARVKRMDSHLKEFFDDQQGFIRDMVGGVEKRFTQRIDKFESEVKSGFKTIDDRLSAHDRRFESIDRRFDRIDGDLEELKRNVRLLVGRKRAHR